ncbi:LLM class flavin-dependent oxidoreductase [Streptomyces sp. NPDC005373]|uniref:LLM class flavin-dependent oxidoreductase n=1 Tax=Streptomyces sp. NPDC005373 TaxID=3156879 RepID=UPI0033BC7765
MVAPRNPVQFGVFLNPQSLDIGRLREQVQTAEAVGMDYASIQDHPYVPAFLDAFTLIGTLIGETERLRFMTNVANLPLRPPAMLAKAGATLDLLSGDQFELGLGGGYNWPGIVGMGGPHLTPGQVVTSVDEAISVLRGLWTPGHTISLDGEQYAVEVETGPAPPHDIGIWLGAAGPRMPSLLRRWMVAVRG